MEEEKVEGKRKEEKVNPVNELDRLIFRHVPNYLCLGIYFDGMESLYNLSL